MKKMFICLLIVAAFVGMACKSAPVAPADTASPIDNNPVVTKTLTQQDTNDALRAVYATYQPKLDMSGSQEYTVVWGDTLSKITRRYYGDLTNVGDAGIRNGFYYPIIMLASPDSQIVDPDLIIPGLVLQIIDLRKNLDNPVACQAIKDGLMDVATIYHQKNKTKEEEGLIKLSNSL
jgi:nucleoid-associated protein YgaU